MKGIVALLRLAKITKENNFVQEQCKTIFTACNTIDVVSTVMWVLIAIWDPWFRRACRLETHLHRRWPWNPNVSLIVLKCVTISGDLQSLVSVSKDLEQTKKVVFRGLPQAFQGGIDDD